MNKIGAEEFRQKVLDALKKVDSRYEKEDLFFTQYRKYVDFNDFLKFLETS